MHRSPFGCIFISLHFIHFKNLIAMMNHVVKNGPMPFEASVVRLSDIDCEPLFSSAVLKLKLRLQRLQMQASGCRSIAIHPVGGLW